MRQRYSRPPARLTCTPVPRALLPILLLLLSTRVPAQLQDSTAALRFTRSVSVPLNALRLYDVALDAWTWTWGRQPGATLRRADRQEGVIEGEAQVPFRSQMLTGREESMGIVRYRVVVRVKAGECLTVVSDMAHTGNRTTPRGGVHLGSLTQGEMPTVRVPGMGRNNVVRLYAEVKQVSTEHIRQVMQAFDARLRAMAEP